MLNVISPPPPASVDVIIAARAIPAGSRIGAEDISKVTVTDENLSKDVLTDTSALVGRVAVLQVPEKAVLSESMLLSSSPPAGLRQVPIRVSDQGITKLVSPGSRVSIFGLTEDGSPAQIASSARVVTILTGESSTGIGQGDSSETILLLEVSNDQAVSVATASLQRNLSLILE